MAYEIEVGEVLRGPQRRSDDHDQQEEKQGRAKDDLSFVSLKEIIADCLSQAILPDDDQHKWNPPNRQDEQGHRGRGDAVQQRLVVELPHAGPELGFQRRVGQEDDDEREEDANPLSHREEHVKQVAGERHGAPLRIRNLVGAEQRERREVRNAGKCRARLTHLGELKEAEEKQDGVRAENLILRHHHTQFGCESSQGWKANLSHTQELSVPLKK